ncbi:Enamine deaminase RidA, house cleaning of reactive enamine intermediates, YjgF/YER057c/UK114 family [Cyclobacterium xiamenense]|uniref:Enamine deaminase RidA, house cleaning of reactive enamine intermediates, YjgF/YER057c/UK114 family n=1 Tax=Cyclobacterium xiamenense TaxID=1297121 RepID=A0A1H6XV29_9BACT|nr:RidA family protein [Cyclobacterium xiamenense]SEJ28415.1 Enamine deaminase RidA, house cleaning of reactive enamine intermediates, YjgF/YER057c/UK114 family [Cyclobacterium xiamenense]
MKNYALFLSLSILTLFSCTQPTSEVQEDPAPTQQKSDGLDAEQRLRDLGIELILPNPPTANYLKAKTVGNLVYLAGHGPDRPDGSQVIGKLGSELELEEGIEAARFTGISLLSSLKAEIGDLNRVKNIVRAQGMVNADPSFKQHSQVINGFSDLMVEVFGEKGKHARAAIGMSSLPNNIAVEIDMIVELYE